MLEFCSCGRVDFVPGFSDSSARPVNRYGLGLSTANSSRNDSRLLARGLLVLRSSRGCPSKRAENSCSWLLASRPHIYAHLSKKGQLLV